MKITLLYFASYKEQTGIKEEIIIFDPPPGPNVILSDILDIVCKKYPNIKTPKNKIVAAINEEYQSHEHKIKHGDIIALIPPVSGG